MMGAELDGFAIFLVLGKGRRERIFGAHANPVFVISGRNTFESRGKLESLVLGFRNFQGLVLPFPWEKDIPLDNSHKFGFILLSFFAFCDKE